MSPSVMVLLILAIATVAILAAVALGIWLAHKVEAVRHLVNGHSSTQAAEIKKLHAHVERLLKLLPPDTPEDGTP